MSESCEQKEQGGLYRGNFLRSRKKCLQHACYARLLESIRYCCSTTGSPKLLIFASFQNEKENVKEIQKGCLDLIVLFPSKFLKNYFKEVHCNSTINGFTVYKGAPGAAEPEAQSRVGTLTADLGCSHIHIESDKKLPTRETFHRHTHNVTSRK